MKILPTGALGLALLATACEGGPTFRPSRVPASSPAPAPSPLPPVAILEVVDFSDAPGALGVRLVLKEASGRSGAWVQTPILLLADGQVEYGEYGYGCGVYRVEAGRTWDMEVIGACAPVGDGSREGMTVLVSYTDDQGRPGSLRSVMSAR